MSIGSTFGRISCRVQWNSICKLCVKQISKWPLNLTECPSENFSKTLVWVLWRKWFKIRFNFIQTASVICFRIVAMSTTRTRKTTTRKITNDRTLVVMCRRFYCVSAIKNGNYRTWKSRISCSNTACSCVSSSSLASLSFNRWTARMLFRFPFFFFFLHKIHFLFNRDGRMYWLMNGLACFVLLFILALTWFKKVWILMSPINEDEPCRIELPENRILRIWFRMSNAIIRSALTRFIIYVVCISILILSALIHLVECEPSEVHRQLPRSDWHKYSPCLNTWVSVLEPGIPFRWINIIHFLRRQSLKVSFWHCAPVSSSFASISCSN